MVGNEKVRMVSMTPEELFLCYDDLEMETNPTLYSYESTQLQYFLSWMSLLKAISLGDQSFIRWCYSSFPNLKLISQNFPRVLLYPSKLICNSSYYKAYRHEPIGIYIPFYLIENLYKPICDKSTSKSKIVKHAIVEYQNSTIEEIKTSSTIPSAEKPINSSPPAQTTNAEFEPNVPSDISSSCEYEVFDIAISLDNIYQSKKAKFDFSNPGQSHT